MRCSGFEFPSGTDANDVAVAATDPTDVLSGLVRSATWIGGSGVPAARAAKQGDPSAVVEPDVSSFAAALLIAAAAPVEVAGTVVSPVPPAPVEAAVSINADHELVGVFGSRRWRVRGLAKVSSFDMLRLNVLVSKSTGVDGLRVDDRFHVDTLDLYSARARLVFVKTAADELALDEEVVKKDLGRVLLAYEEHAEAVMKAATEPVKVVVEMTDGERVDALAMLKAPDLLDRVAADFGRIGMVGEVTNCLVGYLAAISRKLDRPLAGIVQSTSAAGKSALMEAVLGFCAGGGVCGVLGDDGSVPVLYG